MSKSEEQVKSDTLRGGREMTVTLETGHTEQIVVSQIKVRDYDKAFNVIDDNTKLIALACERPEKWVLNLSPESYGDLEEALYEVNSSGFFRSAVRQMQQRAAMFPPDLRQAMLGANQSTS